MCVLCCVDIFTLPPNLSIDSIMLFSSTRNAIDARCSILDERELFSRDVHHLTCCTLTDSYEFLCCSLLQCNPKVFFNNGFMRTFLLLLLLFFLLNLMKIDDKSNDVILRYLFLFVFRFHFFMIRNSILIVNIYPH